MKDVSRIKLPNRYSFIIFHLHDGQNPTILHITIQHNQKISEFINQEILILLWNWKANARVNIPLYQYKVYQYELHENAFMFGELKVIVTS